MHLRKHVFIIIFLLSAADFNLFSQEELKKVNPVIEIFTDFRFAVADPEKKPCFNVTRAWAGGEYITGRKFKGTVILNLVKLADTVLHDGNNSPVREASIGYDDGKLKVSFGITGTRIMSYQIRFYDKRYVANTFQSLNNYGYLFDAGLAVDYSISEKAGIDFTVMNGEGIGHKPAGSLRFSSGFNFYPVSNSIIRAYCDFRKVSGLWQTTLIGFAGFTVDILKIGGEFNYRTNHDKQEGHHVWGVSATGSVNMSKNLQMFVRFDRAGSVIAAGDAAPWNYRKDNKLYIIGLQRTLSENARIAFDYQLTVPDDRSLFTSDMFFINAHFRF